MIINQDEFYSGQEKQPIEKHSNYPIDTIETFQKGRTHIPVFKTKINLPDNCYFRDDRIINSLLEHTQDVFERVKSEIDKIIARV